MSNYNNQDDSRQPYFNNNNNNNNGYQHRNNRPFNGNKFNPNRFNPNVINELRDKNIQITWKNKEENDLECFKVLNTFYAYGEGWMKLLAISNSNTDKKTGEIPQELLDYPMFIRIDDIKYFRIIQEN